jgi:hypothetical protein
MSWLCVYCVVWRLLVMRCWDFDDWRESLTIIDPHPCNTPTRQVSCLQSHVTLPPTTFTSSITFICVLFDVYVHCSCITFILSVCVACCFVDTICSSCWDDQVDYWVHRYTYVIPHMCIVLRCRYTRQTHSLNVHYCNNMCSWSRLRYSAMTVLCNERMDVLSLFVSFHISWLGNHEVRLQTMSFFSYTAFSFHLFVGVMCFIVYICICLYQWYLVYWCLSYGAAPAYDVGKVLRHFSGTEKKIPPKKTRHHSFTQTHNSHSPRHLSCTFINITDIVYSFFSHSS